MLVDAISSLNLDCVPRVVVGVLQEHVDKHCGGEVGRILAAFDDGSARLNEIEVSVVVISAETCDQVQTVQCILQTAQVVGPIFLKDCDNKFRCDLPGVDGVATLEITKDLESLSIPASKSYASVDGAGYIDNIVERRILGPTFCVGGYAFADAQNVRSLVSTARHIQKLASMTDIELSVSDIIWLKTIQSGSSIREPDRTSRFVAIPVSEYEDWGTLQAWQAYTRTFRTLFVDVDGTLVRNSGKPGWGTQPPLIRNVQYLKMLRARGRTQVILTTSRTESYREIRERRLADAGIPYDHILFGMFHAPRVLISDYAKTNPFPSAVAVNLRRDGDDLPEMLPV